MYIAKAWRTVVPYWFSPYANRPQPVSYQNIVVYYRVKLVPTRHHGILVRDPWLHRVHAISV
jgi:hypothetical protein